MNKGLAIGIGIAAVLTLVLTTRVEAAGEFVCPYDGLVFPTLADLQNHVMTEHPGERIPISISWS